MWKGHKSGAFSVKSAYHFFNTTNPTQGWPWKQIWRVRAPTKVLCFTWLVARETVLTQDNLIRRGIQLQAKCSLCGKDGESASHLFIHCPVTIQLWHFYCNLPGISWTMPNNTTSLLSSWNNGGANFKQKKWWKVVPDNASALKAQLDQQKGVVENLVSNTRLLESKIQEAKSKKDTLKARAQSAKTATKVSEMLGNVNTSSALSAFERMEEKVLTMESQADALNQLTSDELEGKFAMLETSSVDDDLASLKRELTGSSKKGELPPGRTTVASSSSTLQFQDSEIEKELNELRRRANDF
nr:probable membrane-associated 30 kDa protein, chloroplastic [Nicotiana tomentosiformis]